MPVSARPIRCTVRCVGTKPAARNALRCSGAGSANSSRPRAARAARRRSPGTSFAGATRSDEHRDRPAAVRLVRPDDRIPACRAERDVAARRVDVAPGEVAGVPDDVVRPARRPRRPPPRARPSAASAAAPERGPSPRRGTCRSRSSRAGRGTSGSSPALPNPRHDRRRRAPPPAPRDARCSAAKTPRPRADGCVTA